MEVTNNETTYFTLQVRIPFPVGGWESPTECLEKFKDIYAVTHGGPCVPQGMAAMWPDHDGAFSLFIELPPEFREKDPHCPEIEAVKDAVFEHVLFPVAQTRLVEVGVPVGWFYCFTINDDHHHINWTKDDIVPVVN